MVDVSAAVAPEPGARTQATHHPHAGDAVGIGVDGGQPVPDDLRHRVEVASGGSLADVVVHDSPSAHTLSDRHRARAATIGRHVALGRGTPRPGSLPGDALLAHELAHAAQQAADPVGPVPRELPRGAATDQHDADAVAAAAVALGGRHAAAIEQLTGLPGEQQRRLAELAPRPGPRRGGLRLDACSDEIVSTYEPNADRFQVVTRKLHALYKRLSDMCNGKEPLTGRKEVDAEIAMLVDELAKKFGVRLKPDDLYEARSGDPAGIDHLLRGLGAKMEVTPAPPHHMLQRLRGAR